MVSNESSVNYNELGDVTTAVDTWLEDETGSTATLCVKTRVWSMADGVTGWGIAGQSGYEGNGNVESGEIVSGVINYDDVVVDVTSKWPVNKTHDGWTATCTAKSWGEVVEDREAYPLENEVTCSLDISATTSYTVSYNANGGTGAPSDQIKWHNEALILSDTIPTKTGHTFKGWGISESATDVTYAAGVSYTENSEITLYAIWEPNTYTVRYNANSGIGAPENQTKVYGQTLVLSSIEPTRTGYTFKGWATSSSGSVAYQPGDDYTNNSAVTLYAVWEIIKYTITYKANHGCNAPEAQIKEYGQTITITDGVPFKAGYKFLGWSTYTNTTFNLDWQVTRLGGDVSYQGGDDYSDNADLTLYAVWELIPIMKMLNGYEIYDDAAREQINGVVTEGDGAAYTADVNGIARFNEGLRAGASFTMIPHVVSTSTSPTLNVNGLGAKNIRQRISSASGATTVGSSNSWLAANKPVRVVYDGTYWVVDFTRPDANNLYGTVPIASGGTGGETAAEARNNLGLGNTDGALPIENGGTNATTAADALNNLGITWGTDEAPATGTPNTIYIQIN